MASLQELKQIAWKMGSQLFEPIIRATASSASKHIIEAIVPVSRRDREVIASLTPTSAAIQAFIATQNSLGKVQQQQKELEEADLRLKEKITRENLFLYRESLAQNWKLAQQNLARQSELYRQEQKIKLLLSELWNNLKLESQQVEYQQNDLGSWQIQVDGETSQCLTIFSNKELEAWNKESQRPLFICAKMHITDGCPDYFRTELPADTESQIKIFFNTVFKEDELTCKLMLRVANRTIQGWLNEDSIKTFPCEDLKTIDGLWVECSCGNFGFSVQKKLWQECGGKVGEYDYEAYKKFAKKVGWYHFQNDTWLTYNEFAKDTNEGNNALPGSFPLAVTLGVGVGWGLVVYLLSHRSF